MDFNEYQRLANRTINEQLTLTENIANGCMGLAGETGEVADLVKKHLFQGHELNRDKLAEEIGDILWYIALLAKVIDIPMGDIAAGNIKKLEKRYPSNTFNAEDSIRREDMHE